MLADRDLTDADRRLLDHAATGQTLVLGRSDGATDPEQFAHWPEDRDVSAQLLVELLSGSRELPPGPLRPIRLVGARIRGRLDLNTAEIACPGVVFMGCAFDEEVDLASAQLTALAIAESYVPRIEANSVHTSGSLNLSGVHTEHVGLITASIGGQLILNGARLDAGDGIALEAWGLTVARDLWGQRGLEVTGALRLSGAHIGGSVGLEGATLRNPDGFALYAPHLDVEREMLCSDDFSAEGSVDLSFSHIRRRLDLRGARLKYEPGFALDARGITVDQSLSANGLDAKGTVNLFGAQVGDSVTLGGARLSRPHGDALDATNLRVGRDLWFREGCRVHGGVNLLDAQIGGVLDLTDTTLSNAGGRALTADRMTITRALIGRAVPLSEHDAEPARLVVSGMFSLAGARIGDDLDLDGARFSGVDGPSLLATDAHVEGNVYCRDVKAQGKVDLLRIRVARSLLLDGAELRNLNGDALDAGSLVVGDQVSCSEGFFAHGGVNLTHGQVGGEVYLMGATMVSPGRLVLAGRRLQTGGDVRCTDGFEAVGEARFMDAQIKGRLTFADAVLRGSNVEDERTTGVGLNLLRLETSGLVLTPARPPEGIVDLTDASVGAFNDAKDSWPRRLRLRGFTYRQLDGEGVRVGDRLEWVTRHEGRYAPGVYDELAAAYRRAGHLRGARLVGLGKEKRRRVQLGRVGKAWSWFLWATVGYGYRTWLAAVWLVTLVAIGSVAFSQLHPEEIRPSGSEAPQWNAVVYTADVVFPLMDLGHQSGWRAGGAAAWWVLCLTLAGWLLVTAVVAGLTNSLNRD
jgi:hypothetical protein